MKNIYLLGLAALAMASCTNDDLIIENPSNGNENGAISFSMKVPTQTRATVGSQAAALLGNEFNVYAVKKAPSAATYSQVFQGEGVYYANGSLSESNSKGWEYVTTDAVTPAAVAGITRQQIPANQQIRYWDYSAPEYWFYAVSAANASGSSEDFQWYDSESTPAVASNASTTKVSKCVINHVNEDNSIFYADAVKREKSGYADLPASSQTAAQNIMFNFKRLQTKVRIGFYETVPGYAVSDVKFYPAATLAASTPVAFDATPAATATFVTNATTTAASKLEKGFMPATGCSYTINYDYADAVTPGVAKLENTTSGDAVLSSKAFGQLNYPNTKNITGADAQYMGESSLTPSWATADGTTAASGSFQGEAGDYYWFVLPNEDKSEAFKLKIDYTLTSLSGTKETIKVTGAEVVIPAEYCKWNGNYAYTYLFKISKNTNGTTGAAGDTKGLYPLTFDACVVDVADGTQGTSTEITDYSISTFQAGSTAGVGVEYAANKDMVVTILDNTGAAATLGTGKSAWYVYTDPTTGIATKTDVAALTNGQFTIAAADVKNGVYAISYKWNDGTKDVKTTNYVRVGAGSTPADEEAIVDVVSGGVLNTTNNTFVMPGTAQYVKAYDSADADYALTPVAGVYTIAKDAKVVYNQNGIQYKSDAKYYANSFALSASTVAAGGTVTITDGSMTSPTYTVEKADGTTAAGISVAGSNINVASSVAAGTYTVKATAANGDVQTQALTVN